MKAFRKLLQRTPFYGLYKALGHYPDYWYWLLRGKPVRSPHLLKQRTVQQYARQYDLRILVETGTYYEYDPQLAQRAIAKFARDSHIKIFEGDSQKVIPELLKSISQPALFWLDAGYYGWAGLQGNRQRLTTELEAILHHPLQEHVILMDDARGLNGQNGAPTVAELQQRIESEFPGRQVEVQYDILRITKHSAVRT